MFLSSLDSPLQLAGAKPLHRQICERIRCAISAGALKPGDRLPSARALAQELGVARGTIGLAYSLLASEGYVQSRRQAGTVVTPDIRPATPAPATPPRKGGEIHDDGAPPVIRLRPESILPFQMGLPALDAFPRKVWARLGAGLARSMQAPDMVGPSPQGAAELRMEIAAYLQLSRGIACSADQVFITSGYRQTLELIVRALLQEGDDIWLEDPGYPPTRELLKHARLGTVPVPVDDNGLVVSAGLQAAPNAKAVVVTPAHQSPLCVSLSLPRRLALLGWASHTGSWIIEDDYDGEYRYVGRPLPALKSLDRDGRVLYAGTFSKVLFPAIRLAYLVVPDSEIARFRWVCQTFSSGAAAQTQALVARFMSGGHFSRHIQRMRKLYHERRNATAAGLTAMLGESVGIAPAPGGMHLMLKLRQGLDDSVLARTMWSHGLYAQPLSDWRWNVPGDPALLLGFANIESQAAAEALAKRIRSLI